MAKITLRMNNTAANDLCAICGQRTDPQVGPELFLKGTWSVVCRQCGLREVPDLVEFLDNYRLWESGAPDPSVDWVVINPEWLKALQLDIADKEPVLWEWVKKVYLSPGPDREVAALVREYALEQDASAARKDVLPRLRKLYQEATA